MTIDEGWATDETFLQAFASVAPAAFVVPIDSDQSYWPKITSRVTDTGSMESNPLHRMSPDLDPDLSARVFVYAK